MIELFFIYISGCVTVEQTQPLQPLTCKVLEPCDKQAQWVSQRDGKTLKST